MTALLLQNLFDNNLMIHQDQGVKVILKLVGGKQLKVDVESDTNIQQLRSIIEAQTDAPNQKIKIVYKGKITNDNQTMKTLGIVKSATMMVVINKYQKKKIEEQPKELIPTNFQTGLGSFNPVGFGNFGIMNNPQYMSALSSMNSQKIQEMMDDPYYQQMMEQLLNDPDTLVKMIEQNPMTKQMMNSNPMMKMMMSNPSLLKQVMNPQNMKKIRQMQKNGGLPDMKNSMFGSFNQFSPQPVINSPNLFNPPPNPLLMNPNLNPNLFNIVLNQQTTQQQLEIKYKTQLKELQLMGFTDKIKCIEILKSVDGDVDRALEKLCAD